MNRNYAALTVMTLMAGASRIERRRGADVPAHGDKGLRRARSANERTVECYEAKASKKKGVAV